MSSLFTPWYCHILDDEEPEEPEVEMDQPSRKRKKKCCCKRKKVPNCAKIPQWMRSEFATSNQKTPRIVGGKKAKTPIQWQAQVKHRYIEKQVFCGGTILDKYTILSAAHCDFNKNIANESVQATTFDYIVQVGSTNSKCKFHETGIWGNCESYNIKKIVMHPKYNDRNKDNDFCIIKLTKPLVYNKDVRHACLPKLNANAGNKAVVSGWGLTECK